MDYPRCLTCRFWQKPEGYENVGTCTCPKVIFATGKMAEDDWKMHAVSHADEHVLSGDECAVVDGSGYFAKLMPGPEFGCVHHEPLA